MAIQNCWTTEFIILKICHYTCTNATTYLTSAVINLNNLILISLFRLNFRNNSKHDPDKPYIKRLKEKKCFEFYLLSFAPLYRIFFVVFSLLALGTSGYFYSCCILYVFLNWPTLDLILTALRRSGMFIFDIFTYSIKWHFYLISAIQLISVGILGLAVLFLYAVFSFIFLHSFYDRNADLYCNTLLECYFSVIRMGLLDTLGVSITV